MIDIRSLVDDAKCHKTVRRLRWLDGLKCAHCDSADVTRQGHVGDDDTQPERRRYLCKACGRRFDDLTGTVFAGHHQPLKVWVLCLYFMGLNLSNQQIARELSVHSSDAQKMATQLRSGVVERKPLVTLYRHQTVNHGRGEYARDDDHDGFCEVHVNTIEGFWSRIRSWLRPHRGLSQECLPLYLGFFEFVYNARRRGAALLESLVGVLVAPRIAG